MPTREGVRAHVPQTSVAVRVTDARGVPARLVLVRGVVAALDVGLSSTCWRCSRANAAAAASDSADSAVPP